MALDETTFPLNGTSSGVVTEVTSKFVPVAPTLAILSPTFAKSLTGEIISKSIVELP